MDFAEQLMRLMDAAREGSRGVKRDECIVLRDDLNELINQFLELENYYRDSVSNRGS